ncbi:hypothetical protein [Serratia plymuthica]|uniref:hypothetical protein n=1 Tax=Serratia plymuthica TaxID=82996 RepID=UPI0007A042AA|nr:hypothetical protein [Serratia plymuthica]KYQ97753.1 hypothetical protein AWY96_04235 [Serratia plymuthica]QPS57018.1 hypothetical protein I6G53_05685 [Serratia plymuthica]CAI1902788.1 Uncharacterised protein [Serratia plymuthica]
MRKSLKVLSGVIIVVVVALTYVWPYIVMEFAGSAHYTEQDRREYDFYTPDILREMPRISSHYDFDFANITGPASLVYAVRYYDTDDSSKVEDYLNLMGYKKQDTCHIEAVCWRRRDPHEIVTVSTLESPKAILVSVIYNF